MDNDILEREGFDLEELERYKEQPPSVLTAEESHVEIVPFTSDLKGHIMGIKISITVIVFWNLLFFHGHYITLIMLGIWLLICYATRDTDDLIKKLRRFNND